MVVGGARSHRPREEGRSLIRRLESLVAASFFVVAAVAGAVGAPAGSESRAAAALGPGTWSQFRLDGSNNAVVSGDLSTSWSVETGAPISASPTLSRGMLFIGNNAGALVALDVRSGRRRWLRRLRSSVMAQPIVTDELVIVGEGNQNSDMSTGVLHVGDGENAIVAFERTTGKRRWIVHLSGTAMPTPAIVGGMLVVHDGTGDLVGIDAKTGLVRYVRNAGTVPSMTSMLPIGGPLAVTAGETDPLVVAIDTRDGELAWKHAVANASGLGDCPLVLTGGRLVGNYLYPTPPEREVQVDRINEERAFALDAASGRALWDVHVASGIVPDRNQAAIPIASAGRVFFGSSLVPWMHAFDAATGRLVWRTQVAGPVKGAPVLVRGVLYFGDLSGRIWALDARTGNPLGTLALRTPFNVGSSIVVGRTLVIGSATGRIVAIPLDRVREAGNLPIFRTGAAQHRPAASEVRRRAPTRARSRGRERK